MRYAIIDNLNRGWILPQGWGANMQESGSVWITRMKETEQGGVIVQEFDYAPSAPDVTIGPDKYVAVVTEPEGIPDEIFTHVMNMPRIEWIDMDNPDDMERAQDPDRLGPKPKVRRRA